MTKEERELLKKDFKEEIGKLINDITKKSTHPRRLASSVESDIILAVKGFIRENTSRYEKLKDEDNLQFALENYVLKEKYKYFFSDEERDICRERLAESGYFK